MSKISPYIILFMFLVVICFIENSTSISEGKVLGKTLYVGGGEPGNYTYIQDAIENASDGDTVFVYDDSSPYYEHVVINIRINLMGENKDTTIIDAGGSGDVICIDEYANGVTISGFSIQNAGIDIWGDAGIEIRSSNNIITGNIIRNNKRYGIYTNYDYEAWVNTIAQNIITDNEFGITLDWSFYNNVYGNYVSNNEYGIFVGLSVLPSSEMLPSSGWKSLPLDEYYNNIYRNVVTNNTDCGVIIHPGWYTYVFENNITNNMNGILVFAPWLTSCSKNYVYQNNIINNNRGVRIIGDAYFPSRG